MWYPVKTPEFVKLIFPELIWDYKKNDEKRIYLTFDDGPNPGTTPWILDTLKYYNAKATFFCVGANVEKNEELYQNILNQGHKSGNHSNNHLNGWKTKTSLYLKNVEECANKVKSNLFRPPYGKIRLKQKNLLLKQNYKIVMWDIIAGDFDENIHPETCLKNITNFGKEGSIIVLHDSVKAWKNLEYVLPKVLKHYSDLGYSFNALED
jgi:peptidoglycan/xylan/chitin deacetylase (PgdA/CDA1 family)